MGSKSRLVQRLRQNDDFKAIVQVVEDFGLRWRVETKGRAKHPKLILINDAGEEHSISIPCSPRGVHLGRARRMIEKEIHNCGLLS